MNIALRRPMTLDTFLAWDNRQPLRYEIDGFQPVATPSVRRYVVLQQSHIGALVFTRHGDVWVDEVLTGDGAILAMPEIGIEIPLAEIYPDLALAPEEASGKRRRPDWPTPGAAV